MNKYNQNQRRQFLKSTAAAAIGSLGLSASANAKSKPAKSQIIKKNATILLQGDSITDAGRIRRRGEIANDPRALGKGYAFNIASRLLSDRPDDGLKFFNRGNSGWKVPMYSIITGQPPKNWPTNSVPCSFRSSRSSKMLQKTHRLISGHLTESTHPTRVHN
jgi:hypothetical protein